ncbi:hypothetical protein MauCBS54593_002502 [Microsporum audouinii]
MGQLLVSEYSNSAILSLKAILAYRNPDKIEHEDVQKILQEPGLPKGTVAQEELIVRHFGVEANAVEEAESFKKLVNFMSPGTEEKEKTEYLQRIWSKSEFKSKESPEEFIIRFDDIQEKVRRLSVDKLWQELYATIEERRYVSSGF